ncbi:CCA tRNA nucleotidyltransferase, mitochondrial [Podila humilis]|nr:CCA tRNA nucleotidyltransferase, mitochondrial [Podila humilis]
MKKKKLLGLECNDLDIGIDSMMGYDFALLVNDHLASLGHEKRSIAKIATNPEKSKHLETATMVVLGMPLDFVNLRSEVYDEASRIPSEITFGTPSEDAYRRDTTINALFYNIHTRSVEDFTGRGLDDLRDGLIRTPLDPFETFWQDPLRVMRCIRFAARFHFKIVDEAKQAILDPRIRDALRTKISKERIGAELDKMIDDQAGRSTAIGLLHDLNLYDVVFAPPQVDTTPRGTTAVEGQPEPVEDAFKLVWIMEWLLRIHADRPRPLTGSSQVEGDGEVNVASSSSPSEPSYNSNNVYQAEVDKGQESLLTQTRDALFADHLYPVVTTTSSPNAIIPQVLIKDEPFPERVGTRTLLLAGMLYPYRNMSATVNKKPVPAASWILRYGLKGKNQDIDIVTKLMECQGGRVRQIVDAIQRQDQQRYSNVASTGIMDNRNTLPAATEEESEAIRRERADMGMVIRDIGNIGNAIIGKKWPCAFILALSIELLPKFGSLRQGILDDESKTVIAKYNAFMAKAESYRIDHCFAWKYLVDGKELTQLLNIRPGPRVTEYLQHVMHWQLMYPRSSKEECQEWIRQNGELFQ